VITDVLSRIQDIRTQIGLSQVTSSTSSSGTSGTSSTSSSDFASSLANALGTGTPTGAQVVSDARKYLGVPYVFGGTNPETGLDCSGLVQRVYKDLGIDLPRIASDQAKVGKPVASLDQAKPGDLVAFNSPVSHIGIYIGDGKMIVAPHSGDVVKIEKVYQTPTAIRRILSDQSSSAVGYSGATALRPTSLGSGSSGVPYASLFQSAAQKYGLPASLLAAVAKVESNYNPSAVSSAGAQGLMQIMPSTAAGLGVNPLDPAQAVDGAARLLVSNLKQFNGSVELALAAYNAGAGAVKKYGGIPPYSETRAYVPKVQAAMANLKARGFQ
jgi:peptidoglycan DL-endopeptidase CwlO